ncbi:MAG: lysylphosphatidylglycerol synthase transmembrane domain-containing protein [Anaerolineaceae bacterium]
MDKRSQKIGWKDLLKWGGTLISLGLFVWLLSKMDWQAAWSILKNMPIYSCILAILLLILGQFMNSLRWYVLLKAQNVPITILEAFKIFLGGSFASNFLPSTIGGDSLRFLAIAKITNDQPLSLASVILDRVVNLIATCTLIPFSISVLRTTGININTDLFAFSGLAVFQGKVWDWIKGMVKKYLDLFKSWTKKPTSLILAFGITWISRFIILGSTWVLAKAIGMQLSLWQVVGVNTVSYFITLLPISISGYGLREITTTTLYTMLGATLEQATALAVISRIFSTLVTLPGVIWMRQIISETKDIKKADSIQI